MTGGRDGRVKFWDTTDLSDTTEPLKIFDLASLTPDRAIPAIRSVCFDGYVLVYAGLQAYASTHPSRFAPAVVMSSVLAQSAY